MKAKHSLVINRIQEELIMKKVKFLYIKILKSENVHLYQTFNIPRNSLRVQDIASILSKQKYSGKSIV